jgi:hypothetical protein
MRSIIISFLLYCLLLIIVRHNWPQGILFYQGILLALVHALAHVSFLFSDRKRASAVSPLKDGLLLLLLSYSFMFTIPTTVDRAYSVHMLNLIATSSDGLSEETLHQDFKSRFVDGGAVDRRIKEQLATGSIIRKDKQVKLTTLGHVLSKTFHLVCVAFSCSD